MSNKVRHVLGISGGKDSAALAIYLFQKYPQLDIEYYFCDTGKELEETYELIEKLQAYLGKEIKKLEAIQTNRKPFDHYLELYRGYLPSSTARWCTKNLKLEPFEQYVRNDPVISYVGIRGDEDREGYISKKSNIQSIFPFRKNIWSQDVVSKVMRNNNMEFLASAYQNYLKSDKLDKVLEVIDEPLSLKFNQNQKVNSLLDIDVKVFNQVVFDYLKTTEYPLSKADDYPLLSNDDILKKGDIFKILNESPVGIPQYYNEVEFEVNGKKGKYNRSRSGCYFCFFQQKIEWVWLYEQHPERFKKAMDYEKNGYSWMEEEKLEDLIKPERIQQIKEEYLQKVNKEKDNAKSPYLLDILEDDGEGCASCFI